MIRSGLLVLGMVLHAGGLLLLALNGREGMGLTLYSASIFLLAISALLRRKGWSPGS